MLTECGWARSGPPRVKAEPAPRDKPVAHDQLEPLAAEGRQIAGLLGDARSRLEYIARLTGEAAEKVLNRVDEAKIEQE